MKTFEQILQESQLKEIRYIHDDAIQIYHDFKNLKREGFSVKDAKLRLMKEYKISKEKLDEIISEGRAFIK